MRTGKMGGVKKQVKPEGAKSRKRDAQGLTKGQRSYRKKLQKQQ